MKKTYWAVIFENYRESEIIDVYEIEEEKEADAKADSIRVAPDECAYIEEVELTEKEYENLLAH